MLLVQPLFTGLTEGTNGEKKLKPELYTAMVALQGTGTDQFCATSSPILTRMDVQL